MRNTDYNSISNKRVFSLSGGLGAYTIGSEEWKKGKEKQERINNFVKQLQYVKS